MAGRNFRIAEVSVEHMTYDGTRSNVMVHFYSGRGTENTVNMSLEDFAAFSKVVDDARQQIQIWLHP